MLLNGPQHGWFDCHLFLGLNPKLGEKLAGVILSAPQLGLPESAGLDAGKKVMLNCL